MKLLLAFILGCLISGCAAKKVIVKNCERIGAVAYQCEEL